MNLTNVRTRNLRLLLTSAMLASGRRPKDEALKAEMMAIVHELRQRRYDKKRFVLVGPLGYLREEKWRKRHRTPAYCWSTTLDGAKIYRDKQQPWIVATRYAAHAGGDAKLCSLAQVRS